MDLISKLKDVTEQLQAIANELKLLDERKAHAVNIWNHMQGKAATLQELIAEQDAEKPVEAAPEFQPELEVAPVEKAPQAVEEAVPAAA